MYGALGSQFFVSIAAFALISAKSYTFVVKLYFVAHIRSLVIMKYF
jgi:hypothetical protein